MFPHLILGKDGRKGGADFSFCVILCSLLSKCYTTYTFLRIINAQVPPQTATLSPYRPDSTKSLKLSPAWATFINSRTVHLKAHRSVARSTFQGNTHVTEFATLASSFRQLRSQNPESILRASPSPATLDEGLPGTSLKAGFSSNHCHCCRNDYSDLLCQCQVLELPVHPWQDTRVTEYTKWNKFLHSFGLSSLSNYFTPGTVLGHEDAGKTLFPCS